MTVGVGAILNECYAVLTCGYLVTPVKSVLADFKMASAFSLPLICFYIANLTIRSLGNTKNTPTPDFIQDVSRRSGRRYWRCRKDHCRGTPESGQVQNCAVDQEGEYTMSRSVYSCYRQTANSFHSHKARTMETSCQSRSITVMSSHSPIALRKTACIPSYQPCP